MKYVLVTGAYGGMGRKTVERLKDSGYRVFALDKRVESPVENVVTIEADLTKESDVIGAFDKVTAVTDELYAIIHFAGIYMLDSLVEMSGDDLKRAFEINVLGAATVNRVFLPMLKKGSRILMTTSELAPLDPLPFTGLYAVTKRALDSYAYSLRMELQLLGIRVSVLRAGAVDTGMLGVSTDALDSFCEKTKLYSCNARRFKKIVETVEARCVPPERIAVRAVSIIEKKRPRFAYGINRNPLLIMLNIMPKGFRFWIIKQVLK